LNHSIWSYLNTEQALDWELFDSVRALNTTCVSNHFGFGVVMMCPQEARFESIQNTTKQHAHAIAALQVSR
jgi:hypothetical protein